MNEFLHDLTNDPLEKTNLSGVLQYAEVEADLRQRVMSYFETYAQPEYDLWQRGSAKSNVAFNGLWQDAWGNDWKPEYSG